MARLVGRRLVGLIATLLVASAVIYAAVYLSPGSPLGFLLHGHPASRSEIALIQRNYHLNDPVWESYGRWLGGILHGNVGTSLITQQSVWSLLKPRIATSALLLTFASLLIIVFGIGTGIIAASRPRRLGPALVTLSTIGMSIPGFVVAIGLITFFAVDLHWFPPLGAGTGFIGHLHSFVLPAIALALYSVAYVARITRTALVAELHSPHVETARARGLNRRTVFRRHVMRNSWGPINTVVGITAASLVAGDAIIEQAFNINGVGAYLVQSVLAKDFPVVQAIALLMVAVFVTVNAVVDIVNAAIDPQIRDGTNRS